LEELLHPGLNPAVLRLGGRDPEQVASAAAIATAFGFRAVNLNCGCPSASVSARATGSALMREPALVAQCLDAMSESMDQVNSSTILAVKHRLGGVDAKSYDAALNHAQGDQQAHKSCYDFVQRISYGSKLSRIQVHTRIALLGSDALSGTDGEEKQLWVPSSDSSSSTTKQRINHQRVQLAQMEESIVLRKSKPVFLAPRWEQWLDELPSIIHVRSQELIQSSGTTRPRRI
jgi:hypothetical protein